MPTDDQPQPADKPEPAPRPKRRWYQFSLRALLLLTAIVALLLAVGKAWIAPAERQRRAIAWVEELQGSVDYVDPPAEQSWVVLQLREWLPRTYFDDIQSISLHYARVTDAGLVHLKGLTTLEWLYLSHTQVTDAGLVHLKGLTALEGLFLNDTQVTDAGLVHLKGLAALEELILDGTLVTDAGLVHLKGLTALHSLSLDNTQVTDAGKADLKAALPNCSIFRTMKRRAQRWRPVIGLKGANMCCSTRWKTMPCRSGWGPALAEKGRGWREVICTAEIFRYHNLRASGILAA